MKLNFLMTLFSLLLFLSFDIFAQRKCTIEPGIGCGEIRLGMTKPELESILGEGIQNSSYNFVRYKSHSLTIDFDLSNRVTSISFVINPRVYGDQEYNAFSGSLPKNLSLQTNPTQIIQLFGKPVKQSSSSIIYPGIEFGFIGNDLAWVTVSKLEQPAPTPKPASPKTLAELDCKIVLNFENCLDPLFRSSQPYIQAVDFSGGQPVPIGKTRGIRMQFTSTYGFLMSVEFFGTSKLWGIAPFYGQPTATLKWGDNIKKAISELGEPIDPNRNEQKIEGFTLQRLQYKGFRLLFENGKLMSVAVERDLSDRQKADERAANDYTEKNKTPEQKAGGSADARAHKEQQMETDYKELLNQLDTKLEEGNRIIRTEMIAIAAGGMFKNAVQKKLDRVRDAGDSLIDQFSKKYQGMIPAWMVKGIQEKWRPIPVPN